MMGVQRCVTHETTGRSKLLTSQTSGEKENARLEAFSDGVFAIAITLLVLDLHVPVDAKSPDALASELWKQWPSYMAFVTSFGTVLIMWINHHGVLKFVRRADKSVMFANGLLLLTVTAVPFPTHIIAEYLSTPAAPIASAVYAGFFVLVSMTYNLLWAVAAYKRRLLVQNVSNATVSQIFRNNLLGFGAYVFATAVAAVNPQVSFGICALLWIFWALVAQVDHS